MPQKPQQTASVITKYNDIHEDYVVGVAYSDFFGMTTIRKGGRDMMQNLAVLN